MNTTAKDIATNPTVLLGTALLDAFAPLAGQPGMTTDAAVHALLNLAIGLQAQKAQSGVDFTMAQLENAAIATDDALVGYHADVAAQAAAAGRTS